MSYRIGDRVFYNIMTYPSLNTNSANSSYYADIINENQHCYCLVTRLNYVLLFTRTSPHAL